MRAHPYRILSGILIAIFLSSTALTSVVLATSQQYERQPSPSTDREPERGINPETGRVSFIGAGDPIPIAGLSAMRGLTVQDHALSMVNIYGPEFGLKDPTRELKLIRSETDPSGKQIVHYQQLYQGIPILSGEIIVNLDEQGDLLSISGEVSPDLSLATEPAVEGQDAGKTALAEMAALHEIDESELTASDPELWIFDESLLKTSSRPVELVWHMEVTASEAILPIREMVLVNAQTGEISFHTNQVDNEEAQVGNIQPVLQSQPTATPTTASQTLYADLVVDEARSKLYGADRAGNKIDVIDMNDLSIVSSFVLAYGSFPIGIALSPDGNELAVAQSGLTRVKFINLIDGTLSDVASALSGTSSKATDILYGRPGILYALSNNGIHVINTTVVPHTENTAQYLNVDGSSNGQRFGELSSDRNTLYYVTGIPWSASNILGKVDVSVGLTKPTILKKASLYQTSMMTNLRLSLIDDSTLLISTGIVYNTVDLTPKARNGQTLTSVAAIPTRGFYVTAYDNPSAVDSLYFFDKNNSYKVSMLETVSGAPGAIAVTNDGSRLFVSSSGGMIAIALGNTPPGTPVPLPGSLRQYRDFAFDMSRHRVYGTDASNRIDVIDQDTGSVLDSYLLPNGANPIGINLSPDGNELAVALNGLEKILFINPESGAKIAEVTPKIPDSSYYTNLPYDVIYGRSGRLYAAGHPSSYGSDYLHVIDTGTHTWLARSAVYLDTSDDLALTSDQRSLFANEFSSSYNLHTFNIQTDTLTQVSEDAISAKKFAATSNGSKIFTVSGSVWDTTRKENLGTLEGAPGNLIEYIPGQNAVVLAAQDGNNSLLKFMSDTHYHLLTTYHPQATGTILEMEIAPDGSTLIANFSDGSLLLLDISTILPVPPSPPGSLFTTKYADLVIDETRGKLYGADQTGHKIDVINMSDLQVVRAYPLVYGSSPTGLDLSPDGNVLAVAQSELRRVAFINLTDGTISDLSAPLSGSNTKVTDVLYGRPGTLYALSNNGLHVIDTSVIPPVESTTQYVSLSSGDSRFGALSSDKNTLYYATSAYINNNLTKFNVSAGLTKPVKLTEAYLNKSDDLKNIRLSLVNDSLLLTSLGTIYQTSDLRLKARNGQTLAPFTALPGRNFYATVNDDPSAADLLNFFDLQSSYNVSTLSTNVSGIPGAVAVTSNGNTLFVSSTGGMAKFAIGATPPGTSVSLPQSLKQYRDFVFDLPRGVIYGTDASNRIDVIEQSTGHLLDSYLLTNGADPIGVDLSPDGSELAVALNGLESILFLDPSTGAEIARVTPKMLGVNYANQPYDVIYGRTGRLYSNGNSGSVDYIHAFDTTTHTWLARSAVTNDTGAELALTTDKKYLYANETWYPNHLNGFDVQTDVLTRIFDTPHGPALANKFTMTPDGTRIFTSDGQIWSRNLQDQIGALEGAPGELIKYIPGKNAVALTVGNTIKFISAFNYHLISTYTLNDPGQLSEMEVSADGVWMILNFSNGGIQILEIASILPQDPPGPLPASIKYEDLIVDEPRGKLYGADKVEHKVDIIDMSNLSVVGSFSLAYGALPTSIDLSSDGNTLAVAQSGFNRVLFINLVDGTMVESPALQNSRYATTKVYDVLYGRPDLLYALTTSGLHVLKTSLNPPAEDGTQFVVFDEDSAKFGAITSDRNTLFVGEDDGSTGHDFVHQFDISSGLTKPVEVTYTSFYNPGYVTQLSLTDDKVLVTSWGSTYDASLLMLKAKHGQSPVPVITLPGRNFYAVAYNNSDTSPDDLYFFDTQSSHKLSSLSTDRLGSPGAMGVTGDGSTLFVSSWGGMTKHAIGATPPGTPIGLPQRVGQYRDFAFDLPRGVIYGTDASGRVDVLDQNTGEVTKSYLLSNGANPMGIDLSPDGHELAVALGGLEAILFMNPETGIEIARVTPKLAFESYYFNWPYDVIYGRDGRLYSDGNTVNSGTNDYVNVYDTTTHTWLGKGDKLVRYASELALTADKKYLYVADSNFSKNNFHVFDVQTDAPTQVYVGTAASQKFSIATDGSKLFYSSGQVWSGNLQQQLGALPSSGTFVKFVPGQSALALEIGGAIQFISASDYQVLSTYNTPYTGYALEMEIAPDGSKLIANYPGGNIFVLDITTFPPPTPIPTSTPSRVPTFTPGPGPSPTPRPSSTAGPSPTPVPLSFTGNRRTYTASGGSSIPGTFLCDQNQLSCTNGANADADLAHKYAADTFVFYNTHHSRNSFDNQGSTIISSVHYGINYQNAGWNGYQMIYGDSMAADDVVGHELTHAVTQYTSNLIYSYQSGAINELFSDIWGEFIDQTNNSGNDIASVNWLMGEDTPQGAIRSMSNPPAYGDPDKMSSSYFYIGSADNGGVHFNSGVNNKAAYLMVQGGVFNGRTIAGIGLNKTASVYYEAQVHHLTMGANYNDLYYALIQACQNLIGGADGITSSDCDQVRLAAEAVEMISTNPLPTVTTTAATWWPSTPTQILTRTSTPSPVPSLTKTHTPTVTPTFILTSTLFFTPTAISSKTATLSPTASQTAPSTATAMPAYDRETTGVFRPSNGLLYLKNKNETGFADIAINYGLGGDYPVVGDWDGDGDATIGIYRNGKFYLRNDNSFGYADWVFAFGQVGDQPIAGDWNGDGIDTIGVYRPSTGQFLLCNSNDEGPSEISFYLGNVGDVGVAGDWDGDGMDTTGVFRPSNGVIFLKNSNDTGFADIALNYGLPGDQPVMGDWNNDGIDTIGIYRGGTFYLRNENTNGFAEIIFGLGNLGDMPIAGDWDGLQ